MHIKRLLPPLPMRTEPKPIIWEMPVYDGRFKHWRILNLSSGSVYASEFSSEDEASRAIEDGTERAGCIVRRVSVPDASSVLSFHYVG